MATVLLVCIPVSEEIAASLHRDRTFPNVPTEPNRVPLHLTLCVGTVEHGNEESYERLCSRLKHLRPAPFDLRFVGTEAFWESALVVLTDAPKALEKLRTGIRSAFQSTFWKDFEEWDGGEFRPHVTVARACGEKSSHDVPGVSPFMHEELPAAEWKVDRFALWIREWSGEYVPFREFAMKPVEKNVSRLWNGLRFFFRTFGQISLIFTCFLPSATFIGNVVENVVKQTVSVPDFIDVAAFLAAVSWTAALASTFRKASRKKFASAFIAFALASSVFLFSADMYELWSCQNSAAEDFECYWILDALVWSTCIMLWLLALKVWSVENERKALP